MDKLKIAIDLLKVADMVSGDKVANPFNEGARQAKGFAEKALKGIKPKVSGVKMVHMGRDADDWSVDLEIDLKDFLKMLQSQYKELGFTAHSITVKQNNFDKIKVKIGYEVYE